MDARQRRPRLGYLLAAAAASLWALNGSLARFLLDDGVGALRLAQLRSLITFLVLAVFLAVARPALLRVRREDVPRLAFLGICGLAAVHATYFFAIEHLEIGVALTIQYLGPLLVLLWLRVVLGRRLPRALWLAALLSVVGCFLVVRAWDGASLDGLGLLAATASAFAFAIYLVAGERAGQRYNTATTLVYAVGFASLFWAIAQPLWSFPFDHFTTPGAIALGLSVSIVGTLLPFICMIEALRQIPASRAAVVATLEPVLAAVIAWIVHGEVLEAVQITGGLVVVCAVVWVQSQRTSLAAEAQPLVHPPVEAAHVEAPAR
jgi:drug/metabolite transporter (DMT)-like permease